MAYFYAACTVALGRAVGSNTSEFPPSKERGGRVVLKQLWSEK